jgi:hypothetical protein
MTTLETPAPFSLGIDRPGWPARSAQRLAADTAYSRIGSELVEKSCSVGERLLRQQT